MIGRNFLMESKVRFDGAIGWNSLMESKVRFDGVIGRI